MDSSLARRLAVPAIDAAEGMLGAILRVTSPEGVVAVRLTEVEAYLGVGEDPSSHAHRGPTRRARSMFGEPGILYAYLSYGIHVCVNVVAHEPGGAGAVLLRAGAIVEGEPLARARRPSAVREADLARGPGRLAAAMGLGLEDDGALVERGGRIELELPEAERSAVIGRAGRVRTSPRTGVSAAGGGPEHPWRFYLADEPSVSPYRAHRTLRG